MSEENKKHFNVENLSMEDDTLGTSISLSIGENSIRIKEKPKTTKETDTVVENTQSENKWWIKKAECQINHKNSTQDDLNENQAPKHSPDVSASMKEFLDKEKFCKAMHKKESEKKDKDDTLCDILASVAFDKYPSDFENATDEDIGSILEEMSKIAGALSPNSVPDHGKSGDFEKNHIEEERSVEELLEEAEKLVRENNNTLSKGSSKSSTLVPDKNIEDIKASERVNKLEADIFQLIEEEVHKETEKIKSSPRTEKGRNSSPGIELVYDNLHGFRPVKTLELQRKRFEEYKAEVSSSSDLDDPIEKHSKSEELKSVNKVNEAKDNLQKEITDVDKDFFQDLLKRTKEKSEGGMSGSSSFGQEDFSHFLKLLQAQSSGDNVDVQEQNKMYNFMLKPNEQSQGKVDNEKSIAFPEKEIMEILEKELQHVEGTKIDLKMIKDDKLLGQELQVNKIPLLKENQKSTSKDSKKPENNTKDTNDEKTVDSKQFVSSNNELYTVDLTPRLELFADAIPKLIAAKSNECLRKEQEESENYISDKKTVAANPTNVKKDGPEEIDTDKKSLVLVSKKCKVESKESSDRVSSAPECRNKISGTKFSKSKSYDQLAKPCTSSALSIESEVLEPAKKARVQLKQPLVPKTRIQSKPPIKPKTFLKSKKEPWKSGSASSLTSVKPNQTKLTDTKKNLSKSDWELLYNEEKHKNKLLKEQIESEAKLYKTRIEAMRVNFEQELFFLKRQNMLLKTKAEERMLAEKTETRSKDSARIAFMEIEFERQEKLIKTYEEENKKLMEEMKRFKEETLILRRKQKGIRIDSCEVQNLMDQVKDLQEETLKLSLEANNLREKNTEYSMNNDDLNQQNSLLKDELEMFKEQLNIKNNFITTRLQAMTSAELALKKQMEDLKVELTSKTEQLKSIKLDYDKLQHGVLPVEKELLELRVRETNLQEKLQVAKSHVEREKQLSQRLKDQVIVDNKKILDLTRQVREMEKIIKRKNPDSMAALILSTNAEHEKVNIEKMKQLQAKVSSLEMELKAKEMATQQKIMDLQKCLSDANDRHALRVIELEEKLLEQKMVLDASTQTMHRQVDNKSVDAVKRDDKEKIQSAEKDEKKVPRSGPKSQNPKEDAHLIATIRGLKLELANKDKSIAKLSKEFQELQKTNRRLQKEREKLLNERRNVRETEKSNRSIATKASDMNDPNSNTYQNGHLSNIKKLSTSAQKLYDPLQFSETNDSNTITRLTSENEILKEELSKMSKDYMALKNKRLHDLNLLQEEHERELADIVKEYSVKISDSKLLKLQSQVNTQLGVITHLRQQIDKLQDYKEQTVVLKAERDHLENKVKTLNEKVKYLSSPGTEQLQLLQDKVTLLQQRHESREMTLQNLVRQLIRSKTQCIDCKGEKNKSRQLCYFRQELDHILAMLQEIANVH